MSATVTLSTTTLSASVDEHSGSIVVDSVDSILPGLGLYIDRELMTVTSLGVGTQVNVRRGQGGTGGAPHSSSALITIGALYQFYSSDPKGAPASETLVAPYINVVDGRVWYAQGDAEPSGMVYRWWQNVTTTYGIGPLGIRTQTSDPTSST